MTHRNLHATPYLAPGCVPALRLAACGASTNEIATVLGVTFDQAKELLRLGRRAFNARNTTHAVAIAIHRGLIPAPRPTTARVRGGEAA